MLSKEEPSSIEIVIDEKTPLIQKQKKEQNLKIIPLFATIKNIVKEFIAIIKNDKIQNIGKKDQIIYFPTRKKVESFEKSDYYFEAQVIYFMFRAILDRHSNNKGFKKISFNFCIPKNNELVFNLRIKKQTKNIKIILTKFLKAINKFHKEEFQQGWIIGKYQEKLCALKSLTINAGMLSPHPILEQDIKQRNIYITLQKDRKKPGYCIIKEKAINTFFSLLEIDIKKQENINNLNKLIALQDQTNNMYTYYSVFKENFKETFFDLRFEKKFNIKGISKSIVLMELYKLAIYKSEALHQMSNVLDWTNNNKPYYIAKMLIKSRGWWTCGFCKPNLFFGVVNLGYGKKYIGVNLSSNTIDLKKYCDINKISWEKVESTLERVRSYKPHILKKNTLWENVRAFNLNAINLQNSM
ncbi:MAG: hypothetical protein PVI75_01680 [Gammaproteobacteria bacterium]|jgi:hypothetical protein